MDSAGFDVAFQIVQQACTRCSVDIIIEKYVPGRELTSTIFLKCRLPLLEIRPKQGYYDYTNKYTAGASEYLVPAPVHSPLYEQILADALRLLNWWVAAVWPGPPFASMAIVTTAWKSIPFRV